MPYCHILRTLSLGCTDFSIKSRIHNKWSKSCEGALYELIIIVITTFIFYLHCTTSVFFCSPAGDDFWLWGHSSSDICSSRPDC